MRTLRSLFVVILVSAAVVSSPAPARPIHPPVVTYRQAGDQAKATLLTVFYAGNGLWRDCDAPACRTENQDWGVDAATYALYLRWKATHDPNIVPVMTALIGTATRYPTACSALPCESWSDVPEWDTIALMRDYEVTGGNKDALARAAAAFRFVDGAKVFAIGACPAILYQIPGGKPTYLLKTLETDANYIKAALLLYGATSDSAYLNAAVIRYGAVREHFLDPRVPLYSVYVYDDGKHCTQLPHRFFASVNGDMIWNGITLARFTGIKSYRAEAIGTAKAVDRYLSDARGIFADLQAENDVEEPLVEAMYDLATEQREDFARSWILRNADAALSERAPNGAFGRFWDGPPTRVPSVPVWQSNGGFALEFAAAALAPSEPVPPYDAWSGARYVAHPVTMMPASISFTGSGIALMGTMGARCCQAGHARVFIDGVETFDRTGIWQNKSMTGSVPNTVLFAWRWPKPGHHVIRLDPGILNAKEGGSFLKLDGYLVM